MVQIDGGLRKILKARLPGHWQSIEAEAMGAGVPDGNYCIDGVEGWVECKQTTGWTVDLSPQQVAWLTRRARAGGRVTVAVRQRNKTIREKRDVLWLLDGALADLWKGIGLPERWPIVPSLERDGVFCRLPGGPAKWDWKVIQIVLRRSLVFESDATNEPSAAAGD